MTDTRSASNGDIMHKLTTEGSVSVHRNDSEDPDIGVYLRVNNLTTSEPPNTVKAMPDTGSASNGDIMQTSTTEARGIVHRTDPEDPDFGVYLRVNNLTTSELPDTGSVSDRHSQLNTLE